jgi:putative transposase
MSELEEKKKWKDQEAIKNVCKANHCKELQGIDRAKQTVYLKQLYGEGLSIRQISRITGLGRWVIQHRTGDGVPFDSTSPLQ